MAEQRLSNDDPWTEAFVIDRLAKLDTPAQSSPITITPGPLHQTAAVLAYYDPSEMQAYAEQTGATNSLADLLSDSTVVYQGSQPQAMLKADARRLALESLGSQDAIRSVLESLPSRPTSPLQRMVDGYVTGRPRILDLQSPEELAATLQVTQWFKGLIEPLPDPRDLERRIEREGLLKPFRDLSGVDFAGREDELARLRTDVGFLDSESNRETVVRSYRDLVAGHVPVVLHAPGGMGKSSLLGRFILNHLEPSGLYPALPFVYLDFDRPVLLPERIPTLLSEAARQLEVQSGESDSEREFQKMFPIELGPDEAISRFASLVRRRERTGPMLFVLDTFEEVQYRGPSIAEDVLLCFIKLQAIIPELRIVVAGRAPVTSKRVTVSNRPLGPLLPGDAVKFLLRRNVDDPNIANAIVAQVGGNPLSLRLVLEVIKENPDALTSAGVAGLPGRSRFSFFSLRLNDTQIQGQLYRRILGHITDPDVRKLAHPGLILRRVTPEVIQEVLAEPCGVTVNGLDRARELLRELQREVSLVSLNTDGSLQHLPELRPIMLDLLKSDKPVQVERIQTRAVDFYRKQTDLASRAELIYHLLMLQKDRAEIDSAWRPGVERFLRASVDEVPASVRGYLSARLGDDVQASLGANVDLPLIEAKVAGRVRDLLSAHRFAEAAEQLETLGERSLGSPLHLVAVETSMLLGDWHIAHERAVQALAEAAYYKDPQTILKLEVTRAWAARRLTSAAASVDDVTQVAQRFAGEPLVIRLALHRLASARDTWTRNAITSAIESLVQGVRQDRRERYPYIFLEAAGLLGAKAQPLIVELVQSPVLQGLLTPGPAALAQLYGSIGEWDETLAGRIGWRERAATATAADAAQVLRSAATVYGLPDTVISALAVAFKDMSDRWRTDRHLYEELEGPRPLAA